MKTLPATHHDLFDKHGCKLCGMPKSVDIETGVRHLDWHIYVLSIAGIASDAESTAGMFRPIGPRPGDWSISEDEGWNHYPRGGLDT